LRRVARQQGEASFALLETLAGMGNHPGAQLAAIEALGDVPLPAAADLAQRWTGSQAPKDRRKAARRALVRLQQRGIRPSSAGAAIPNASAERPERIRRALMSAVNGEGTRLLYLLVDVPMSGAYMAMTVVSQSH